MVCSDTVLTGKVNKGSKLGKLCYIYSKLKHTFIAQTSDLYIYIYGAQERLTIIAPNVNNLDFDFNID